MSRPELPAAIVEGRVVAIGRWFDPADVEAIGAALSQSGIRALEVTCNSHGALGTIEALRRVHSPDRLLIGAGTVLDQATAEQALDAGASFLVSPHTDPELVAWSSARGVPHLPGAGTASEALAGWRAGAAAVKVFPVSVLGGAFVRELRGPFPEIPLVPTGGLTLETAPQMLAAGAVAVGMGGWLTGQTDPRVVAEKASQLLAALEAVPRPHKAGRH